MGVGIWYEMFVSDPVAYLFKNTDPRGSLRANVSNSTVRCPPLTHCHPSQMKWAASARSFAMVVFGVAHMYSKRLLVVPMPVQWAVPIFMVWWQAVKLA